MSATDKTGPEAASRDIQKLSAEFDRVVSRTQAALFWERLWPRMVPTLGTGALFLTASWLGLWPALAAVPVAKAIGVTVFGAAALASPFLVRTKSLFVTRDEALRRLDEEIGDPSRPAQTLRDKLALDRPPMEQKLWEMHITGLWEKWGGKIKAASPRPEMNKRDPLRLRYIFAATAVAAGLFAGENRLSHITEAFNWSAPPAPVIPIPPMEVKAWVKPPQKIESAIPLYLTEATRDHTQGGDKLVAHKNSTLTLLVYGDTQVFVNGTAVPVQEVIQPRSADAKTAYQYEIPLTEQNTRIVIYNGPTWHFEVTPDNAPLVNIKGINGKDENPKALEINYSATDDHGVEGGEIRIIPPATDPGAKPLPSSGIPPIHIPK